MIGVLGNIWIVCGCTSSLVSRCKTVDGGLGWISLCWIVQVVRNGFVNLPPPIPKLGSEGGRLTGLFRPRDCLARCCNHRYSSKSSNNGMMSLR